MKLRNKKTGKVGEMVIMCNGEIGVSCPEVTYVYDSLSEFLSEGWEDYKPTEPLIKDEKIRKAVRAWAEANDIKAGLYDADVFSIGCDDAYISFNNGFADETKVYTIAELCGEEE